MLCAVSALAVRPSLPRLTGPPYDADRRENIDRVLKAAEKTRAESLQTQTPIFSARRSTLFDATVSGSQSTSSLPTSKTIGYTPDQKPILNEGPRGWR